MAISFFVGESPSTVLDTIEGKLVLMSWLRGVLLFFLLVVDRAVHACFHEVVVFLCFFRKGTKMLYVLPHNAMGLVEVHVIHRRILLLLRFNLITCYYTKSMVRLGKIGGRKKYR